MTIKNINKCIVEPNSKLNEIFNFGEMYPTGIFKKNNVSKVKLKLMFSKKFNFGQISKSLDPKLMFNNYYYRSGTTNSMREHFLDLIKIIKKNSTFNKKINILDIGCNDGTFLHLMSNAFDCLKIKGLDPSQAIYDAKKKYKNFEYIKDFFPSEKLFKKRNYDKFNLITCTSVFYDFEKPIIALKKVNALLHKDGVFLCEVNYFKDLIQKCNFDMISHEHLSFYSLRSFIHCCNKAGLQVVDVIKNNMNGGNVVFICKHKSKKNKIKNVKKFLNQEDFFFKKTNWKKNFILKIHNTKKKIVNHLKILKSKNQKVAIYGASTRGDTVLQLFPEVQEYIEFAIDKMPEKHGLFMPGTNIKIYHESKIPYKLNSYFVLPYQFLKEFLIKETKFIKNGGEMFTYRPNFISVNKYNYKKILKKTIY